MLKYITDEITWHEGEIICLGLMSVWILWAGLAILHGYGVRELILWLLDFGKWFSIESCCKSLVSFMR